MKTIYKYRNEFILYLSSQEHKKDLKLKWNLIVCYLLYPYLIVLFLDYYCLVSDSVKHALYWDCSWYGYREYYIGLLLLLSIFRQYLNYQIIQNKSKIFYY